MMGLCVLFDALEAVRPFFVLLRFLPRRVGGARIRSEFIGAGRGVGDDGMGWGCVSLFDALEAVSRFLRVCISCRRVRGAGIGNEFLGAGRGVGDDVIGWISVSQCLMRWKQCSFFYVFAFLARRVGGAGIGNEFMGAGRGVGDNGMR